MAKVIYPSWLPRIVTPTGKDDSDNLRALRVDYKGGLLAGAFGAYYDVWRAHIEVNSGAGGNTIIDGPVVPSGYLYIAQTLLAGHRDTNSHRVTLNLYNGIDTYELTETVAAAWIQPTVVHKDIVLRSGDKISSTVFALPANTTCYLYITGYKVRLT